MQSTKRVLESDTHAGRKSPSVDRLAALLDRFRVRTALFNSGVLCGSTTFEAVQGRAFLHVLRRGSMEVRHPPGCGLQRRFLVSEPTLLLYPRPIEHVFINPPRNGSDFTCATVDFDGGDRNPMVSALPPLVRVPLREIEGLQSALDLLFAETDRLRCGSRLLADRLFEVVLIQLLRWLIDHPQRVGITSGLIMGLADPRLAKSLIALHRLPAADWSLPRMAAEAGMSRSAFAAAFKQAIGTTPAEYLSDWRVTLATSQIRAGRSVKLIAAELGYASASSLSKAFKQRFGASPREWSTISTRPRSNPIEAH